MKLEIYFGMILVIYGLFKLLMGILALTLPVEYRKKVQSIYIVRDFITMDLTMAGRFIDLIVIVFSIYSVIRGLVIMQSLKMKNLKLLVINPKYTYILYSILGLALLVFYTIVVYTDWHQLLGISKDEQHLYTYKLSGIGSGIVFLITVIGIYFINIYKYIEFRQAVFIVIVMTILLFILAQIISATLFTDTQRKNELITMIMIPIGGA